ncbi:hypothetical protein Tco_0802645 [Tanacetum coccineum]|uniref:Uncharacterized protein n=1 Tax=Tanacetum coccineum TaxID=301880 RepID=A0ABQ5A2Z7_9ASTR
MAWVCCCCGALGPIDKLKQQCNTSVTLFQVPTLGHLSPSRFSLLMELLKILSGTIEIRTKLVEDYQTKHASWSSPDLATRVQILVWRAIQLHHGSPRILSCLGRIFICWNLKHPRTISGALGEYGIFSALRVGLEYKHEVPSDNVGGSSSCIAVCIRGMGIQTVNDICCVYLDNVAASKCCSYVGQQFRFHGFSHEREKKRVASKAHSSTSERMRQAILAFKTDKTNNTALVSSIESTNLSVDTSKRTTKRLRRSKKPSERVQAVSTAKAPSCSLDLDYNEAAAELDRLYKLSPATIDSDTDEDHVNQVKKVWRGRNKIPDTSNKTITKPTVNIVRSQHKKVCRLTLENRIHLKSKSDVPHSSANIKLVELLIVYLDLWFLCCSRGKVP